MKRRKGQFFIIAAIIITISLIAIKSLLGFYSTEETISAESMRIIDKQLENIRNEYEYITGIALTKTDVNSSLYLYLSNFSNFIREDRDARALWIAISANGSNQKYNLLAGNYMKTPVSVNITLTNSTPASILLNLSDRSVGSSNLSSQINGSINMTIRYAFEGYQNEELAQFEISEINSTTIFIDLMINDGETRVREKSIYSAKLS